MNIPEEHIQVWMDRVLIPKAPIRRSIHDVVFQQLGSYAITIQNDDPSSPPKENDRKLSSESSQPNDRHDLSIGPTHS